MGDEQAKQIEVYVVMDRGYDDSAPVAVFTDSTKANQYAEIHNYSVDCVTVPLDPPFEYKEPAETLWRVTFDEHGHVASTDKNRPETDALLGGFYAPYSPANDRWGVLHWRTYVRARREHEAISAAENKRQELVSAGEWQSGISAEKEMAHKARIEWLENATRGPVTSIHPGSQYERDCHK